mmetsp:Transcript_10612/g.20489  ORF Transcript_10612/g.20489 Transcript_10612/m.20489 type:complete len:176 (+) Transcript_10612:1753-2280(+)
MGCFESRVPYRPDAAIFQYLEKTKLLKVDVKQLKANVPNKGSISSADYLIICEKLEISLPWRFFTDREVYRAKLILLSLCIMCGDSPKHKLKLLKKHLDHDLRRLTEYLETYYHLKHFQVPLWSVHHLFLSKLIADKHVKEFREDSGLFVDTNLHLVKEDLNKLESLGLLHLTCL